MGYHGSMRALKAAKYRPARKADGTLKDEVREREDFPNVRAPFILRLLY